MFFLSIRHDTEKKGKGAVGLLIHVSASIDPRALRHPGHLSVNFPFLYICMSIRPRKSTKGKLTFANRVG